MTISRKQARALTGEKGRSKYHAKPVPVCPHCHNRHDSQAEAARCAYWHIRKRAGEVVHIDVHPVVMLPTGTRWKLDFAIWFNDSRQEYGQSGEPGHILLRVLFEDVKGAPSRDFAEKRKEFDQSHPAAPLSVVRGRKDRKGTWTWESI